MPAGGYSASYSDSSMASSSISNSGNNAVFGTKPTPNYPMFDFGTGKGATTSLLQTVSPPVLIGFAVVAAVFVWGVKGVKK